MSVNSDEIDKHCLRLSNRMLAPRGWSKDDLLSGYADSLSGFEHGLVGDVVQKLVTGGYDDGDVSTTFAPTPPALAALVRQAQGVRVARRQAAGESESVRHAYKAPTSRRLALGILRRDMPTLVADGTFPRGAIWIPGDPDGDPQFGDVYAPDPSWPDPSPIRRTADDSQADAPGQRMTPDERRHCVERLKDEFAASPSNQRAGFFARDHGFAIGRWLIDLRRGAVALRTRVFGETESPLFQVRHTKPPHFPDRLEVEEREREKRRRAEEARLRAEIDEQGSRGA